MTPLPSLSPLSLFPNRRRYDSQTTTFSPQGRLYQVEYAIAAIQNAASAVGVLTSEGIVVATEKKASSKLLSPSKSCTLSL